MSAPTSDLEKHQRTTSILIDQGWGVAPCWYFVKAGTVTIRFTGAACAQVGAAPSHPGNYEIAWRPRDMPNSWLVFPLEAVRGYECSA